MADQHTDTPDTTKTAHTENPVKTEENDRASRQTRPPAGPGLANRLPTAEHTVMHGQLRRRSAPHYRTERRLQARTAMVVDDTALPAGRLGSRVERQEKPAHDTVFGHSNISEVN